MNNKFQPKGRLRECKTSIITPESAGLRFILNPCSVSGKWDSKLQETLSKQWSKCKDDFKSWWATNNKSLFKPGLNNVSSVQSDTWVINMLCLDQDGSLNKDNLSSCVKELVKSAKYDSATIHLSDMCMQSDELKQDFMDLVCQPLMDNGIHVYVYSVK